MAGLSFSPGFPILSREMLPRASTTPRHQGGASHPPSPSPLGPRRAPRFPMAPVLWPGSDLSYWASPGAADPRQAQEVWGGEG